MNTFMTLLLSLALVSSAFVSHAQVPMRALDPRFSAVEGDAGWNVDTGKGNLGITIPVATVPGEIPIPVVFRYQASYSQLYYCTGDHLGLRDFPIAGSVHFGYITSPTSILSSSPSFYCVMEDGTQYSSDEFTDFATFVGSTFSLPPTFKFAAKPASSVRVNSTGTLVMYSATASDLSYWASKIATPVGFTAGSQAGCYQVLMDRDKARVFAFAQELNAWVPVLWVDRFGHWVSFQWRSFSRPDGSSIRTVIIQNHRSKGLQVQWTERSGGATAPAQILVRLDFIGMQAPTLQITGFEDSGVRRPAALGGAYVDSIFPGRGGPRLRPTEIRIGNPGGIAIPYWISALPQPPAVGSAPWPADLVWNFTYDATQAELTGFTDAAGVSTTLTWQSNAFIAPADRYNVSDPALNPNNVLRTVVSAQSTDPQTGVILTQNWTWILPSSTSPAEWITTHRESWSGPGITSVPGRLTRSTFASPVNLPGFWANSCKDTLEILDSVATTCFLIGRFPSNISSV